MAAKKKKPSNVAEQLKQAIKSSERTQADIAEASGIHQQQLSRWMTGLAPTIGSDIFARLCATVNLELHKAK